jgi:hypothetical protein
MERIRSRIFTVEEANQLLPYLDQALERLVRLGREVTALKRELDVLRAIAGSGAIETNPDLRSLNDKEASYGAAVESLRGSLADVSRHGCIIRDLELGLVDFYTMSRDQIVCLCWRRGESRIEHWHPLDEGFSGRRPIEDLR